MATAAANSALANNDKNNIEAELSPGHRADSGAAIPNLRSLEPIYDLNRRMLILLNRPQTKTAADQHFHADTKIGQLLRDVGSSAQQQLALCPFLLLDAGFNDATYWKQNAGPDDPHRTPTDRLSSSVIELARATCLLSWHLTRTPSVGGKLILGVSQECADLIGSRGLTELQDAAVRLVECHRFTPRWHDRPDVWRRLIRLAGTTPSTLAGIHGVQILLADLLAQAT